MLRRLLILPALAAAALVSACATTAPDWNAGEPPPSIVDVAVETVTVPATQALIVAHNAYQGAAAAVTVYAQSGAMTPSQAERLTVLNDRAIALLDSAGNTLTVAQRAAGVFDVVAEINSIIGRRN